MIVLESVTKRFGAVTAVDGVSFRADKGKFVVLLGPSGCGKSTLLRLIAGLEQVSEGRILIEGRDVTALDPTKRRHLDGVPVLRALPAPHRRREHRFRSESQKDPSGASVRSAYSGWPTCRPRRAPRAQAAAALRRPAPARGARRARSLSQNPICLMDEPLSNLDAQLRHEMRVRDPRAAAAPRHDGGLRHARPGRGDEHGRPRGPAARGPHRAGRPPADLYSRPATHLRGALHRHAGDESGAAADSATRRRRRPARSACAPSTSTCR